MTTKLSRRTLFGVPFAALGALAQAAEGPASPDDPLFNTDRRSTVSLIRGENRRKNVTDSLVAIDEQLLPVLRSEEVRRH